MFFPIAVCFALVALFLWINKLHKKVERLDGISGRKSLAIRRLKREAKEV